MAVYDYVKNPLIKYNLDHEKMQVYKQILRKGVTFKKYRQLSRERLKKVRQVMIRGYPQSLIANRHGLSQPTVSRDICIINSEHRKAKGHSTEQLAINQYRLKGEIDEQYSTMGPARQY